MFDQIKAKLGLDITDFERKIVRTQGALNDVTQGAAKKFTDLKQLGGTLATALGLNIEKISEGIARMIVGFSKEQEDALNKMVESAKNAADQLGGILSKRQGGDDPEKRIELLDRELASVQLQAQARTKLTAAEKYAILAREGPITADAKVAAIEEAMAASREEAVKRIGEISRERLIAEGELKKKNADQEKKDIEAVGKSFKAAADEREKRKFKELSIDGKIASKQAELADAQKAANDQTKSAVERADSMARSRQLENDLSDLQAERTKEIKAAEEKLARTRRANAFKDASDASKLLMLREDILDAEKAVADAGTDQLRRNEALNALEEARANLKDEQARQSANVASSENQAADDVSDKIDNLFTRAAELDKVVKEAKRRAELPTMAEVASGQRDIGVRSREDAKKLAAEEAKIKKLSDNETRLKGQLANAKTAGDRKNIIEEGRQNRAQLDAARARRDALLGGLAGKISDVPFAEQQAAAAAAKAEAAAAGAPPVSAATAAATAAQGAVQAAQEKLTSTAPKPAAGGAGDIATNVSNCVKILGEIKERLDPTSISTT
jgi:hypothetical protein